jgi:hypothetical protein
VLNQHGDLQQVATHRGSAVAQQPARSGTERAGTRYQIGRVAQRLRERSACAWADEASPPALLEPAPQATSIVDRGRGRRGASWLGGLRSGRHLRWSLRSSSRPRGRWPWPLTNRLPGAVQPRESAAQLGFCRDLQWRGSLAGRSGAAGGLSTPWPASGVPRRQ